MSTILGILGLVLCTAEILACFGLHIASHRRGGAMAVGAVLSGITGLVLVLHHLSAPVGIGLLVIFQALFTASFIAFRQHTRNPS